MKASGDVSRDRPSAIPWPPLLLLGLIGLGYLLRAMVPLPIELQLPALGYALIVAAIAVDLWVFKLFKKRRTNIRPDRPATALVTEGPFKWSRNPIYVGNAVILLGFLFLTGSPWFLLMSALFVVLVDRLAIRGEERHMEALFGEAWRRYAASVRRWI